MNQRSKSLKVQLEAALENMHRLILAQKKTGVTVATVEREQRADLKALYSRGKCMRYRRECHADAAPTSCRMWYLITRTLQKPEHTQTQHHAHTAKADGRQVDKKRRYSARMILDVETRCCED